MEEEEQLEYINCECGCKVFYRVRKQPDDCWVYDGVKCAECGKTEWIQSFFYP